MSASVGRSSDRTRAGSYQRSRRECATCWTPQPSGNPCRGRIWIPRRPPRSFPRFLRSTSTRLLTSQAVKEAPLTPDEATQRNQVRRFLDLLTAVAVASGVLVASQAVSNRDWRSWSIVIALGLFAILLQAWPRRILASGRVESAVTVVALASAAVIFAASIISPAGALIAATGLLIPIIAAVPYLEIKSLRRLMMIAWLASVATAAASLLPDPITTSDAGLSRLWGSALVTGLVLFLLYQ